MDLRHFEKHINKQFENYQPKTDEDQIWANIKDHIPTEASDRKPPFFRFFLSILPLVIFAFFAGGKLYSYGLDSTGNVHYSGQSIMSDISLNSSSPSNDSAQNQQAVNLNKPSKVNTHSNLKNQTNESAVEQPAKRTETKRTEPKTSRSESVVNDTKIVDVVDVVEQNQFLAAQSNSTASAVKIDQINTKANKDAAIGIQLNKQIGQTSSSTIDGIKKLDQNRQSNINNQYRPLSLEMSSLAMLAPGELSLFSIKPKADLYYPMSLIAQQLEIKLENKDRRHHISLNSGLYKPMVNHTSDNAELLALRMDSEKAYEMIQLSLWYQYDLSKRISLATGLNAWTFNWASVHQVNSQEVVASSLTTITRQTKTTHQRINADSGIGIPVMVNYNAYQNNRMSYFIGVGYEYNLFGRYRGYESELAEQEYDISSDDSDRYKSKGGHYYLGHTGINLSFSPKTKVQFSVSSKIGTDDFQNPNAAIRKSYQFYGFNLGIQQTIN